MENLPEEIIFECKNLKINCISDTVEEIDEFIKNSSEIIKAIIDKNKENDDDGFYVIKYTDDSFVLFYYDKDLILSMSQEELSEIFSNWNHIVIKTEEFKKWIKKR